MEGFEAGNAVAPEGDFFANGTVSEDMPLDDYVEPDVVRDKQPHTLKVFGVTPRKVTAKGLERDVVDILLRIMDSGLLNVKAVKYTLWMPHSAESAEDINKGKGSLIRYQKAVGMSPQARTNGEFLERVVAESMGAEFQAVLKVKSDVTYGNSNEIARLMV